MTEAIRWVKIENPAYRSEKLFPPGSMVQLRIATEDVCLGRTKEGLFAVQQRCPHAGADLTKGFLSGQGSKLVCPLHDLTFDIKSGKCAISDKYKLRTFPLRITDEGLFIGLQ